VNAGPSDTVTLLPAHVGSPAAALGVVGGPILRVLVEPFLVASAATKVTPRTVGPSGALVEELVQRPMQCFWKYPAHLAKVARDVLPLGLR
jgi:hypothetical protein